MYHLLCKVGAQSMAKVAAVRAQVASTSKAAVRAQAAAQLKEMHSTKPTSSPAPEPAAAVQRDPHRARQGGSWESFDSVGSACPMLLRNA